MSSLWKLINGMAQARANRVNAPPKIHSFAPLELCQESVVDISITPMVLATAAGSLIKEISGRHTIDAVGLLNVAGLDLYRSYLSNVDGAFIETALRAPNKTVMQSRIYTPYAEIFPSNTTNADDFMDWRFWLDNDNGYLGALEMQGRDNEEGGPKLYTRSFSPQSNNRFKPIEVTETVRDAEDSVLYFKHRMMHYERILSDNSKEYLLVSVVEAARTASLNMWLGIDLPVSDMTVYPASTPPT